MKAGLGITSAGKGVATANYRKYMRISFLHRYEFATLIHYDSRASFIKKARVGRLYVFGNRRLLADEQNKCRLANNKKSWSGELQDF